MTGNGKHMHLLIWGIVHCFTRILIASDHKLKCWGTETACCTTETSFHQFVQGLEANPPNCKVIILDHQLPAAAVIKVAQLNIEENTVLLPISGHDLPITIIIQIAKNQAIRVDQKH